MFAKLKITFKHTLIYSLGNISSKIAGLILLPLYTNTNIFSTEDFGLLVLLEITSQIFVAVFALELGRSVLRWCAEEINIEIQKSIIFTSLIFIILIVISYNIVLSYHVKYFSILLFSNADYANYFNLIFIWSGIVIINQIPMSILRVREKPIIYILFSVTNFVAVLLFIIYFVVFQQKGVEGILLGQISGNLILSILTIPVIYKNSKMKLEFKIIWDMLKYGFPLIFSTLASLLLSFGDRYILEYFLPISIVGIYSLGYRIASTVNIFIIQSFQLGYFPIAFKMIHEPNSKRFYSKVLTYYVIAISFISLLIALFSRELLVLISSKEYLIVYNIIPIILLSFIFRGIADMVSLGFFISKKTKYNSIIIISGMLISVTTNFLLIPLFGMCGSAISMLIAFFLMTVSTYLIVNKIFPINYEIRKIILIIFGGIVLFIPTIFITELNFFTQLIIKIVIIILFPFGLFYVNIFEEIEIAKIKEIFNLLKKPFNKKYIE
ncbi:MAG: oligosaccharide flippase family protein [Melioribacteraceae bacterium]